MLKKFIALVLLSVACGATASPPDLETFFRHSEFSEIQLSPGGNYLAATVPAEDRTGVAVLDVANFPEVELTATLQLSRNENATGLRWVDDDRLVFSSTRQVGSVAIPSPTGRLYTTRANGSEQRQIFGPREDSAVFRMANILHTLPDNPRRILISDRAHDRERPMAWLLDVDRYQRTSRVTQSPLERGGLAADQQGQVRFAYGQDVDGGNQKFAWRPDGDSDWQTFDNPFDGNISHWGFSSDGEHVYINSRDPQRLGVYQVHLASGQFEPLLVDDEVEAIQPIYDAEREELIGAIFNTFPPETRFMDPEHPTARIWRSLAAALGGFQVRISNFSDDQSRAGLHLYSDREPGVFMLLDVENMHLSELAAARSWVKPEQMASMRGVRFDARDGTPLHGLLTLPPEADAKNLPLVLEVHGGPYGIRDSWGWLPWVQAMATHGYAVLQVNFRGSGGYGHDFEYDAYGQWGAEMQDDLVDAVQWAIDEGIAHPDRICISGASYGGYAAMRGVTRDPDLFRCAFAFVGVYDLELMKEEGNIPERVPGGKEYLERALGTDTQQLQDRSPVHHVNRISADLFIAHGAEDRQAHYGQYHALIDALEKAGIRHEKMFVSGEGHGFYELDNNTRLYGQALELFDRNIGSGWQATDSHIDDQ